MPDLRISYQFVGCDTENSRQEMSEWREVGEEGGEFWGEWGA